MEKLPMCRICLVENVRMYIVANKKLHELYEKLTDIPFVTQDSRPILACFFCCAKLKQCYQLLRQCLQAEELFAQRMNENYERNPLLNQNHLELFRGFIKSPIEHISIVNECQTESIAVKEELPAVCEGVDDVIEPKEEHQSDELENLDNSCLDVADIPPHSESHLEDNVPLLELKTQEEDGEVSKKKRRGGVTKKLELENLDNSCLDVADIPPHHSESHSEDDVPLMELKTQEKDDGVSKKKRTGGVMKRANVAQKRKLDTRRTKEKDAIIAEQMRKDKSDSKVIRTTQKRTSEPGTYFKEPYKCDQRSFSENGALKKHIHIYTGEKPYKCDICGRRFTQVSSLKRHSRMHTGDNLYECDICGRFFSQLCNLKRHILMHTGEKPYKCDVCQRSFKDKDALTKHIRVHTGEKPFKCNICQSSFSEQSNLRKHIIGIHSGEKPYKCDVCQRNFSQKRYLKYHIC